MTCITRNGWTATVVGAVVLSATVASAQSEHHGHTAGPAPPASQSLQKARDAGSMAMMHKDLLGKMAAEDARLKTFVADMNMLTGDLKVEAIARVVTLLVERQSAMRQQVMNMHEQMMWNMMKATTDTPEETRSDRPSFTGVEHPEMCVPPTN